MSARITRSLASVTCLMLLVALSAGCRADSGPSAPGTSKTPEDEAETTATVATATPTSDVSESDLPFSKLALDVVFRQVQKMDAGGVPIENTIESKGRVPLAVDKGADPPTVSGTGSTPVKGTGRAGGVTFSESGTITYRLTGRIVRGEDGGLELRLSGQRAMDIKASGSVGPSGSTPFEDIGERVLPLDDGSTLEWDWDESTAGVTGSATWTLRILDAR